MFDGYLCALCSSPEPTLIPPVLLLTLVPMGGVQHHAKTPKAQHTAMLASRAVSSTSSLLCSEPGTVAFGSPSACHPTCRAELEIPNVG